MDFLSSLFGTGIPNLRAAEAQEKLKASPKPFLLDVRETVESRAVSIPGATLIPLGELGAKMNRLPKDKEIIVVCASGSRSVPATRQLIAAGYKAFNLQGGMSAWLRAGLPVKR
jgi:rhodanese-related sulfurtransferase